MARPVIRSIDAQRNLDVLLAFAIAGVLGNRFFLVITGYPQLGGGTLHISHAIWGGLMMVIAVSAAVAVVTPGVRLFVAVLGGAGFGWFVDELGKFITRDVNYFFQPTLSIIYLVFIAMYMVFRAASRGRQRPEDGVVNALDTLKLAAIGRLDDAQRGEAIGLLDESGADSALATSLRTLLTSADVVAPHRPSAAARVGDRARALADRLAEVGAFPYAFAALLVLLSASDVGQVIAHAIDPGLQGVSEWAIAASVTASAVLIVVGLVRLNWSRMAAYHWFEMSILIGLFVTQIFLFHIAQLTGVVDLTVGLLLWGGVRAAMRAEDRRVAAPVTAVATAAAGGLE